MAVSILEALMNADLDLREGFVRGSGSVQLEFASEQLHNAVTLLEKGYGIGELVEPLLERHGTLDAVPHKSDGPHLGPNDEVERTVGEILSAFRDVARRIGPARRPQDIREELEALLFKFQN